MLIIFGFGYIGSAVAEKAMSLGWTVRTLVRSEEKAAALRSRGIDAQVGDIAEDAWHGQLMPEADYVLNSVSASGGDYERTYVGGNRSLMNWAQRGRVGTFVYTSTTGVYPDSSGAWIEEAGATKHDDVFMRAEDVALQSASSPARSFVLRLGGIYGPGRHYLLDMMRSGQAEIPGRGDFFINFIHRDDAVRAILAAFTAPAGTGNQAYNVTDGSPALKSEVVDWIAAQIGKPGPVFRPDLVTPRLVRRGGEQPSRKVSSEKITKSLGWRPVFSDFRKGYADLLTPDNKG